MKRKNYVLLATVLSSLMLTACSTDAETQVQPKQKPVATEKEKTPTKSTEAGLTDEQKKATKMEMTVSEFEAMKEKINTLEEKEKTLSDEVTYYRTYVKDLTATFSKDKMNEFINKEWNYSLTMNNINFPKDGILEIEDKNFNLVLKEERVAYSLLSEEDSKKGMVSKGVKESLVFDSANTVKHTETEEMGDVLSTLTYSFKDVPAGSVIKLELDDELKKKTQMTTNLLEIRVK